MTGEATATRALIVVSCVAAFTGKNKKDEEFTIYGIEATNDEGTPVTLELRSFDDLSPAIGKVAEYEVKPYRGQNGMTYTLKPKNKVRLESRVKELEERVAALEEQLQAGGPPVAAAGNSRSQSEGAIAPRDDEVPI